MSLTGLHHIHLKVPDLEASRAFAIDFGLVEAERRNGRYFLRGAGSASFNLILEQGDAPSLAAIAFGVDSDADLDAAVRDHGAADDRVLNAPGGGRAVTLVDPEGRQIHLVHGSTVREADKLRDTLVVNYGYEKPRRGTSQSFAPLGAPPILRLGHIGLFVRDARACDTWYREVLGLIPSDIMYAGVPENIAAGFYRIDRGDEWVDHHTVAFFALGGKSDLHHISFEVQDSEVQFMAHRWMAKQGRESVWGVGRHPKGSHIFDVWRDPSGYRFETFSDTDLCTASRPADVFPVQEAEMDMWSDRNFEAYFA